MAVLRASDPSPLTAFFRQHLGGSREALTFLPAFALDQRAWHSLADSPCTSRNGHINLSHSSAI
jgi:hypothetical protein